MPILAYCNKVCKRCGVDLAVNFTSNGYLLTTEIIDFLNHFNCSFQITLDGHKPFHDRTRYPSINVGTYDKIVANIIDLAMNKIDVIVRINYTVQNSGSLSKILGSFEDLPKHYKEFIRFDFQRVWQDSLNKFDEINMRVKSIRLLFKRKGFVVLDNYILHDVSCSCYADKRNYVLINYDGMVYGCTARDFAKENSIGRLNSLGVIDYKKDVVELRNSIKFSKGICWTCRIAPICGGGCKQKAYETLDINGCAFNYNSYDKDNIVLDIFEHYILNL